MPEGGSKTGIEDTDWAVVGARLTAFAVWLLRNRRWAARASDNAGLGRSAEDLASEAIADVLCGRCRFDPERGNLESFLRRRVRWKVSHLAESAGRVRERAAESVDEERTGVRTAEESAVARQRLRRLMTRVEEYMKERKRKFDLAALLEAVCEKGSDAESLAGRLGLDREQVYYQLRVLRKIAVGLDEEDVENGR